MRPTNHDLENGGTTEECPDCGYRFVSADHRPATIDGRVAIVDVCPDCGADLSDPYIPDEWATDRESEPRAMTDGGVSRFEDGPRECPYEEDYQHWVADGLLVVHGHPVGVVCDCGDEMEFDAFYGARNETAGFACACGLDFVLAPAKCTPDHWECFADGGHEATFLLADDGEYHFGLEREDADDLIFRVQATTMTDDEPAVATDGGREMTEWECGNCGDSFETPGEPELPCLQCGADDWQEVGDDE